MKMSLQNRADRELSFQAREHQIERFKSIRDIRVNFSQNSFCEIHTDFIVKLELLLL